MSIISINDSVYTRQIHKTLYIRKYGVSDVLPLAALISHVVLGIQMSNILVSMLCCTATRSSGVNHILTLSYIFEA